MVARQIALTKLSEKRTQEAARDFAPRITLEELARRAKEGEVKELSLVVKADAQGTLEAVLSALQKIEDPVVAIKIVGQGVGAVSDSDLLLAGVSNAIIGESRQHVNVHMRHRLPACRLVRLQDRDARRLEGDLNGAGDAVHGPEQSGNLGLIQFHQGLDRAAARH